jgi:hypothetical protein
MKTYFSHLCSCTNHKLTPYNVGRDCCDCCIRWDRPKCYHVEVCHSTKTELLLQDLESSIGEYYEKYKIDSHHIQSETKLQTDPTQADREVDVHHIDYVIPDNEPRKKREYMQFTAKECMIHKINIRGLNVDEWQEFLHQCMTWEEKNRFLLTVWQWH